MSKAQRTAILDAYDRGPRGYVRPRSSRTQLALLANGWMDDENRPIRAGLIAAGVDMDALAADAAMQAASEGRWIAGLIAA